MSYPTRLALMAGAIFLSTSVSFLSAMNPNRGRLEYEEQPNSELKAEVSHPLRDRVELDASLEELKKTVNNSQKTNASDLEALRKEIFSLNIGVERLKGTSAETTRKVSALASELKEATNNSQTPNALSLEKLSNRIDLVAQLVKRDSEAQDYYNVQLTKRNELFNTHLEKILTEKKLDFESRALTCFKDNLSLLIAAFGIVYSPAAHQCAYNCAMAFLAHLNNMGIPLNDGPCIWAALSKNLPAWVVQDMYLTTAVCALLYLTCKEILKKPARPKFTSFSL